MTVRPGVNVIQRSTPPSRSIPSNIANWYVVGLTEAGPTTPTLIRSMADYERLFGSRVSYGALYDALDVYFREGGNRAYVSRVVGPNAVISSHNLADGSAGVSLTVKGLGPGSYYDGFKVGVRAGVGAGTFVIFVTDTDDNELETSPDLIDQSAALVWAADSNYVAITRGASAENPAVAAAAALAGGSDDRASITDDEWKAAIDSIATDFGSGQISAPGRTTDTGHQQLLAGAFATSRVAILDAPDTATVATVEASASACRAGGDQRFGGMFWPWLVVPGIVVGTTRTVPPSALVAAKIAKNDSIGAGANAPAAGDAGVASYVTGLSQTTVSDATRTAMNTAGVNVIRAMLSGVRIYGWRTLTDSVSDSGWVDLGNARLFMAIAADGGAIAEGFVFEKIDGQGRVIAAFNGALSGMLQAYFNNGDLYGDSAGEAFYVDTGDQVNTIETIAAGELHAVLNVRMAMFAEMVEIEVYKRALDEVVS